LDLVSVGSIVRVVDVERILAKEKNKGRQLTGIATDLVFFTHNGAGGRHHFIQDFATSDSRHVTPSWLHFLTAFREQTIKL
jgi:hypothetical protein